MTGPEWEQQDNEGKQPKLRRASLGRIMGALESEDDREARVLAMIERHAVWEQRDGLGD